MVPADLKDWVDLIYKVGFPIFVALYLLVRVDKLLSTLIIQQQELLGLMRDLKNALYLRTIRE
jgi:hypothetical protein